MEPSTAKIISGLLIFGVILYLFILAIIARVRYADFLNTIRKIQPDFEENLNGLWVGDGGKWMAGEYWFRTPFYINYKCDDEEIMRLIKKHDKIIKLYWISVVTILPIVIIILNIIN